VNVSLRRATPADVDFLVELVTHEDVDPYLSARRARAHDEVLDEITRSEREPYEFGRFLIEVDGERAGVMGFETANRRSRIAYLHGLAVHPRFRGRRLADDAARLLQRHLLFELGFHRLQLEIYAFNERAIVHAERSGFVREGVRRKAYRRHGGWVDGVIFGLVLEDVVSSPLALLHDYIARHNEGVRTGDWDSMLELFADDATLTFEGAAIGPFDGRDAIAAAYRERPPDDEVSVKDATERDGVVGAAYTWRGDPSAPGGEIWLNHADGKITHVVVIFG
jgi:RimJ/RimL family protein N-acetyltransferase